MGKVVNDKRAQQLTLGTIILIVLGVAVLVFLIFGFSTGWNALWDKVTSRTSGSNLEDVKISCETDCMQGEESAFCLEKKDLRIFNKDGKTVKIQGTCNNFRDPSFDPEGEDFSKGALSSKGFTSCSEIKCSSSS